MAGLLDELEKTELPGPRCIALVQTVLHLVCELGDDARGAFIREALTILRQTGELAARDYCRRAVAQLDAIAAPIMRSNIDTDVVIRINRMVGNSIRGTLGKWAFEALRYLPDGTENPGFILNREPYRGVKVLITGPNFGCGSSREAAVWALEEFGIKAIIGSSFGGIFYANCFQNGVLPIVLDKAIVDELAAVR